MFFSFASFCRCFTRSSLALFAAVALLDSMLVLFCFSNVSCNIELPMMMCLLHIYLSIVVRMTDSLGCVLRDGTTPRPKWDAHATCGSGAVLQELLYSSTTQSDDPTARILLCKWYQRKRQPTLTTVVCEITHHTGHTYYLCNFCKVFWTSPFSW